MNVYLEMAAIKKELLEMKIKKSGKNAFAGFNYFELDDILPKIISLNAKHGVDDTIQIDGVVAKLILNHAESNTSKTVMIPCVQAQMLAKGGGVSKVDDIQRLGATVTYLRRYLYMTAYDITEKDIIDALDNTGSKAVKVANDNNHTEKKEKAITSKSDIVERVSQPNEQVSNTIRKTNSKIWGEIITKIKEVAFDCDVEKENLDGHLEDEPYNYFVNELKLKTSNGKLVGVEFMKQDSKPLVANNIVTVVDDDFYVAFAEYLKAKVFLPF